MKPLTRKEETDMGGGGWNREEEEWQGGEREQGGEGRSKQSGAAQVLSVA